VVEPAAVVFGQAVAVAEKLAAPALDT